MTSSRDSQPEKRAHPERRPVLVVTGPSGAGKGTLIRELLKRMPELELAVSATTRLRRPGEEEGRDYYFLSDGEFARRVARGDFLEHVTYVSGQRYGTLRSEVERIAQKGRICVLELETEGALKVAEELPEAVTVFVTAPLAELERRLRERATESSGEIGERLDLAESQLRQADLFDYVVENDDLERAVEELERIVRRELVGADTMSAP
ncbi:MAG: guanylate kinase [Thermoleophilia bacterium]